MCMLAEGLNPHYISWRQRIQFSYLCEDIQQLFACRDLATCRSHLLPLQKGTISQTSCATAVSPSSTPQLLQCISSSGTGLVCFWELNWSPSWYRQWSLESYSNNQCIPLLRCESQNSLNSADFITQSSTMGK